MTARRVPKQTLRRIVEAAIRAPSVHNTQPWRWRGTPHSLELYADRSRQLAAADPDGRNLVISCGTALHHARVAADALGWSSTVTRVPDPDQQDLLARLALCPATPSRHAPELLEAIDKRCTDRRRFTSWPVPDERLTHLAAEASAQGARALPLSDVSERFRAELLINRAIDLQRADQLVMREQQAWIDHAAVDGVPSRVLPVADDLRARRLRFATGLLDDIGGLEVESSDGLIVVWASQDDPSAWLTAGEGLSALWLAATTDGLSVVPLSQVVEVAETRAAFQLEVLGGLALPLVVLRVGWQAISRGQMPRTPRRPVSEVLELT
jgi:nitroreductase